MPVAVFSGNVSTAYGVVGASGINSPDMAHEQIPPVGSWSYKYVAATLPPQANTCDTLLGIAGRVGVADGRGGPEARTTVEFSAPPGVEGLPGHRSRWRKATCAELVVSGGDFSVEASGPLLLAQGIDCEPTLALAVSADTMAVRPFVCGVAELRSARRGRAAAGSAGHARRHADRRHAVSSPRVATSRAFYEVARVPLATCPPRELVCTHRLTGQFGMTLRGMDVLSSYALTAPSWPGCIDPPIRLASDLRSRLMGTEEFAADPR